jgi:mannose-6-phosphate isomerase-like protein (cupin superfamily)
MSTKAIAAMPLRGGGIRSSYEWPHAVAVAMAVVGKWHCEKLALLTIRDLTQSPKAVSIPHMEIRTVPSPGGRPYQEFLRSNELSVGVYRLQSGAYDSQQPHNEDEVYYVLAGRAKFTAGEKTVEVEPGICLCVPAREPHRFHDIADALEVLVVFGPAEPVNDIETPRAQ